MEVREQLRPWVTEPRKDWKIPLRKNEVAQGRWVTFVNLGKRRLSHKTYVFECRSIKDGTKLGIIKWYALWRSYAYYTDKLDVVLDRACLREIAVFCEEQSRLLREENRKKFYNED